MTKPLTPDAALVRLSLYGERTKTWSTATHDTGTERALHEIATTLGAEVTRLRVELAARTSQYAEAAAALAEEVLRSGKRIREHDADREEMEHLRSQLAAADTSVVCDAEGHAIPHSPSCPDAARVETAPSVPSVPSVPAAVSGPSAAELQAAAYRKAAGLIEVLPQDFELDPGRGNAVQILQRLAAEALATQPAPVITDAPIHHATDCASARLTWEGRTYPAAVWYRDGEGCWWWPAGTDARGCLLLLHDGDTTNAARPVDQVEAEHPPLTPTAYGEHIPLDDLPAWDPDQKQWVPLAYDA
ncbi:hypothetical protein [Streptomyces albidoflavus]|uniref:hypothetical protein n=1 Tax=Streptomyces albidoflavus TaxID=1886 RepID=UPI00101F5745|nr:hypothetical protein [Streptomyces albidoflavus]RZF02914.1 hypothetical protein C0R05_32400 [Streptomyces albidoflavus]